MISKALSDALQHVGALVLWEAVVLALSYGAAAAGEHEGRLYRVTYEQDPFSWFAMAALWMHFFAVPVTAVIWVLAREAVKAKRIAEQMDRPVEPRLNIQAASRDSRPLD